MFKYKEGSYIPKHKDPSSNRKVYRLNIVLVKANRGGEFICPKCLFNFKNRVFLFRADTSYHKVTKIENGQRILLSLGFKLKEKA